MNEATIVIEIPDVGIIEKDAVLLPHGYGIEVKDRTLTEALAKASFHGQELFGALYENGNQTRCAVYLRSDSVSQIGGIMTTRFIVIIGRFLY
jgi:hypothetical protein